VVEAQVVSAFSPVVILTNIMAFIEPVPEIAISDVIVIIEDGDLDLFNVVVNRHLVLEPMIKHVYFHAHLSKNRV
jgi:hypothetical protein